MGCNNMVFVSFLEVCGSKCVLFHEQFPLASSILQIYEKAIEKPNLLEVF